MIQAEELTFKFDPSESEELIAIYEHFIDLHITGKADLPYPGHYSYMVPNKDLDVLPKKEWYAKMNKLIDKYGYEKYRNHVKETIEAVIVFQKAIRKLENRVKSDSKKGIYSTYSKYISNIRSLSITLEAPTHFYFYASEKGRYLKGMILSVACIPDPILLKLIEKFAIECPFQSAGNSQATTGLYVYDTLEVFSTLKYPDSIPYIMNLKANIRQTWAQKKFDKYLNQIAKKQKIESEEIIEIGISNYGFNQENIYETQLGTYSLQVSFLNSNNKQEYWINTATGKKQKAIPKEIKEDFPEALKYIKNHIKEIETQLSVQAKRIEHQYLTDKSWDINFWKEKYLEHSFIGILTKELLWLFINKSSIVAGFIENNAVRSVTGQDINISDYEFVKLWHPMHIAPISAEQIKEIISKKEMYQPFKQVNREFYGISFMEQLKGSKMKKAILSQLCKNRNWSSSTNHNIKIPKLDLTATLLLQDFYDDTRGIFSGSEHVKLKGIEIKAGKNVVSPDEINPVTLSEILRDVDLFINVAKAE